MWRQRHTAAWNVIGFLLLPRRRARLCACCVLTLTAALLYSLWPPEVVPHVLLRILGRMHQRVHWIDFAHDQTQMLAFPPAQPTPPADWEVAEASFESGAIRWRYELGAALGQWQCGSSGSSGGMRFELLPSGTGPYVGFSSAITEQLLTVLVLPSARHCCRACGANVAAAAAAAATGGSSGLLCGGFIFTPGRRCYLTRYVPPQAAATPELMLTGVPGLLSGIALRPAALSAALRPQPRNDTDGRPAEVQPLHPVFPAQLLSELDALQSTAPATFGAWGRSRIERRQSRAALLAAMAQLRKSRLGGHIDTPASELAGESLSEALRRHSSDDADVFGRRPRHWLLTAGIDCCGHSKLLNAATGLAFAGFDALITMDRSDYLPPFRREYERMLLHQPRGAGYWVWKPYFLLRVLLELAQPGDWVFYSDAGVRFEQGADLWREKERRFLAELHGGGQDVLVYAEGSPELRHTKVATFIMISTGSVTEIPLRFYSFHLRFLSWQK
jgi:hypothetical protein